MSQKDLSANPFAALFGSVDKAQEFTSSVKTQQPSVIDLDSATKEALEVTETRQDEEVNKLVQEVFHITLNDENHSSVGCVFLNDLREGLRGQRCIGLDTVEQAVFERLMLQNPAEMIVKSTKFSSDLRKVRAASVSDPIKYLASSYVESEKRIPSVEEVLHNTCKEKFTSIIVANVKMYLIHPEVFGVEAATGKTLVDLLLETSGTRDGDLLYDLFGRVAKEIDSTPDEGSVWEALHPVLAEIHSRCKECTLGTGPILNYCELLMMFTKTESLVQVFMRYITPANTHNGKAYENTLLGSILSISCAASNNSGPYEFFNNPSRSSKQEHDATEGSIQQPLGMLTESVYRLVYGVLKSGPTGKSLMLQWLGSCIQANKDRAKLWSNTYMPQIFQAMCASDGFFLNLCSVMLQLCAPFSQPRSPRLLRVQPTYCMATVGAPDVVKQRNVHMIGLDETSLVPGPSEEAANERALVEKEYSFVSECFFMSHYCLHVGFHVVHERFMKLNQDLHRIQSVYMDIVRQGGDNSQAGQSLKTQMEKAMTVFLCLKAALTEPRLLDLCFNFHVATATYLVHMATDGGSQSFSEVMFPLPEKAPVLLSCIPEFMAENILDYLLFLRRFKDSMYEMVGDRLEHIMTFILVMMGSPQFVRNPHLRARMAEALEALLPPKDNNTHLMMSMQRETMLARHPLVCELAPTLMRVFVSIEMTGQGVEFEQKFNYRRPMYNILECIWKIEVHRKAFRDLADTALNHVNDAQPPLFLHFINLLINDAIFLLDEALSYMSQIKEKQGEQDSGALRELSEQQRMEANSNFSHLSMLAKFHNLMARDTIHCLEMMSREIKSMFNHAVLVDRVAAMLNYFLLHLVGPKKKNLKVKDFDRFEFKPQELVSNICAIYINLGGEDAFCVAVSNDGRSYSSSLFTQAKQVLEKIHQPPEVIMQFTEVAAKVKALCESRQGEDELVGEAPEEFLDPIMGTLMTDPVKLPSSGLIVDRTTIARHLLSDQTDPFNRAPLTMDLVEAATELKDSIKTWLTEQKKS